MSVIMKTGPKNEWEVHTRIVPSQLVLIIAVQSSKGEGKVGENGAEREAVRAGRFSICSQSSCAGGLRMDDDEKRR